MYHKDKSLGLILGQGALTKNLIENCKKKKIKFFIISLDGNYNESYGKSDLILKYNELGNIFKYLRINSIPQVLFLGKIKKKKLINIRPDFITLYYLIKLLLFYFKGDGELLNKVLELFISKDIKIIDPRVLLLNNLCKRYDNKALGPNNSLSKKEAKEFFLLAKKFGEKDIGQAVIISDNKVVLGEDKNGTDHLIKNFKKSKFSKPAFLVKVSKPNQDLFIDLPTIGPTTISNIIKAGIKGLIVEDNKTLIENPKLTLKMIKENNLLYHVF